MTAAVAQPEPERIVRSICLAFPEVVERASHGHPGWFIRDKRLFAAYHEVHHELTRQHLWCAAPPGAQEALVASDPLRYFRPKYVGQRGWLGVFLDRGVDSRVLYGLLTEAYLMVCPATLRARFEAELSARSMASDDFGAPGAPDGRRRPLAGATLEDRMQAEFKDDDGD